MPARRLRLRCSRVFTARASALIAVVFLVSGGVQAQTGRAAVTLTGSVSKTVALSIPPNFTSKDIDASVLSSGARAGSSVRLTLSSMDANPVIRVPLLVRSNSGFKISAVVESTTVELSELSVIGVDPTGTLVSRNIVTALDVMPRLSADTSQPLLVLSGPRVSLGGTLDSPNNALQITLLIRLKTQSAHGSLIHLTFVASPE